VIATVEFDEELARLGMVITFIEEHGEKVIEGQKRIAVPRRQLLHHGQVDGR